MKPLATGLLPAPLALKWMLNQPIATAVPGASTLAEVEQNSLVGHAAQTLSERDQVDVERLRVELEHERCRICDACLPCPAGVNIPEHLGTDVLYDHLRTMGRDGFMAYPWSRQTLVEELESRQKAISAFEACTHCGDCESRCPHGLPVTAMLDRQLPIFREMVEMCGGLLRA
jgi:predicted aldo/keto reductase-like oxidoreductase